MGVERGRWKHPLTRNTQGLTLAPKANTHLPGQAFLFTQISTSSLPSTAAPVPGYGDTRASKA